jgi:hypothetical protein
MRSRVTVSTLLVATLALPFVGVTPDGAGRPTGEECNSPEAALESARVLADSTARGYPLPAGWQFEATGVREYRGRFVSRFSLLAVGRRVEATALVVFVSSDCSAIKTVAGKATIDALVAFATINELLGRTFADPSRLSSIVGDLRNSSTVRHLESTIEVTSTDVSFLEYFEVDKRVIAVDAASGLVHRSGKALAGHGSWHPSSAVSGAAAVRAYTFSDLLKDPSPNVDGDSETQYVTGTGSAYLSDPSGGDPALVALPRLHAAGERLDGRFVRVSSTILDDGLATPASGPGASYFFEPNTDDATTCYDNSDKCTPFDNVNAYYHIDRYAQEYWVDRLGLDVDFQANVLTHSASDRSTATGDTIDVGWGGLFLRNNAYEDEILYHEYAHVVMRQFGFEQTMASENEMRSVNEGYADYFSLSYVDQPIVANWATKCPSGLDCDGPANDEVIRTLETDPAVWNWSTDLTAETLKYGVCTRFHEGDGKCKTSWATWEPIYVGAMIWGSTLWDVRTTLGRDVADQLVYGSLIVSGGVLVSLSMAADAIMHADEQLYAGIHVAELRQLFLARGVVPVGIERLPDVQQQSTMALSTYPTPSHEMVTIEFELEAASEVWATVLDLTGRRKRSVRIDGRSGRNVQTLDLGDLVAGFYILTVVSSTETSSTTLVRAH